MSRVQEAPVAGQPSYILSTNNSAFRCKTVQKLKTKASILINS